jgi:P27 family predicted phage terminase small subunit
MTIKALPGAGRDIDEPRWDALIPDSQELHGGDHAVWREYAHREWMRVTAELREAGTLAPSNRHQIQRLVIAYVRYDRAVADVFRLGLIAAAPRSEVAMMNIMQSEMRQADADATTAEMELGITPRRRGAVTKAKRAEKTSRASDRFIKPLSA